MKELNKFYIAKSLDDPDVLCYCTMIELALFGVCLMFGLFLKSFITGVIVGALLIFVSKKIKSKVGADQIILLSYWYMPDWFSGFKCFPQSHKRYFIG